MIINRILFSDNGTGGYLVEYRCEHCGLTVEGNFFDNNNFMKGFLPRYKCPNCGRTQLDDRSTAL